MQTQPTGQQPLAAAPKSVSPCRATRRRASAAGLEFVPARCRILERRTAGNANRTCDDSLAKLRAKTIGTVNIVIAVSGNEGQDFPFECTLDDRRVACRSRLGADDVPVEGLRVVPQAAVLRRRAARALRPFVGRRACQPFMSGAHFFTRLPVLPYCMGVEPPKECIYALGHYRPGNCAPYMCKPMPLSSRGALFQAGAAVGAAAALP